MHIRLTLFLKDHNVVVKLVYFYDSVWTCNAPFAFMFVSTVLFRTHNFLIGNSWKKNMNALISFLWIIQLYESKFSLMYLVLKIYGEGKVCFGLFFLRPRVYWKHSLPLRYGKGQYNLYLSQILLCGTIPSLWDYTGHVVVVVIRVISFAISMTSIWTVRGLNF